MFIIVNGLQKAAADEMKLDQSLDTMIQRVNEMKDSINKFLWKLDHEHETLSWPSVLDNFALLSSQISTFQKVIGSDKTVPLRNYVFVPSQLNPARDEHMEVSFTLRSGIELDVSIDPSIIVQLLKC